MNRLVLIILFIILLLYVLWHLPRPAIIETYEPIRNPRIALFYAYYEKNDSYKENFKYFLKRGLLKDVKHYIIVNGDCSVSIPEWGNVTVFYRPNKGYDFAAYAHAIQKIEEEYDYYFFMNTSVKGPFYPKAVNPRWVDYFLPLFSHDTKLVGTTINLYTDTQHSIYNLERLFGHAAPFPHVQSMFFGMDKELFDYLDEKRFFSEVELELKNMDYVIVFKEIGLSQKVLAKGWNINCILPEYRSLDYRTITKDINPTSLHGDAYYRERYFGKTIQPEQVVFYKEYRLAETKEDDNNDSGKGKEAYTKGSSKGI